MRILYISSEYPPETGYGGIGTYTRHMAEIMAGRGHTVYVISRSEDGRTYRTTINDVCIQRIPPGTYPLPQKHVFYPLRVVARKHLSESLIRLAWAREVRRTIAAMEKEGLLFDVIEYPECNGEGFLVCRRCRTRTVVRLHTPWEIIRLQDKIRLGFLDSILLGRIEYLSVKRADRVTAPSHAIGTRIGRKWKIADINVFPNPIPAKDYPRATGDGIVFLGRVERNKGLHILIDAYARLCREMNPPLLYIIGRSYGNLPDGTPYQAFIQQKIREHSLDKKIRWIKGVEHSEVPTYLRQCAIAVFPSYWENFPYACLEAMACGLSVAASRCGGLPEIIDDNINGRLFETGNAVQLCSLLKDLLVNPLMARQLGEHARISIRERCNPDIIGTRTEKIYSALCGKARA